MRGFGKRVTIAFLSVVALLTVAGVISLFELSNLSYDTSEMLSVSGREMEAAKSLLSEAHNHRRAMLDVAIFEDKSRKEACKEALDAIKEHASSASVGVSDKVKITLDTLVVYGVKLQQIADSYHPTDSVAVVVPAADKAKMNDKEAEAVSAALAVQVEEKPIDARRWIKEVYDPAYDRLVKQVELYATLSQEELTPRKDQLSNNAYRTVMPVLISLAVMIAIVLMLYYFIYIYAVKPILAMNRSLSDYLSFKMPYKNKVAMIDEVKSLNDNIEHLINASQSNIKQE